MNKFKELIEDASKDHKDFFEKGNKAAGTRLRVKLQTLKVMANELRAKVQEVKNK
jgi:hypothetical protein